MKNNLEDQLWSKIEELEWKKDNDCERIEQYLKDNFTLPETLSLVDFINEKVELLYNKYESSQRIIDVSDDGFNDLTNEVVGRGKEFYENITVEKLQEMVSTNDYHENFFYGFQFSCDYEYRMANGESEHL